MFRLMVFDAEKDGSIKNNQFIISLFQFIIILLIKLMNSSYNIHRPLTLISYEKTFRIPKKLLRSLYGCR